MSSQKQLRKQIEELELQWYIRDVSSPRFYKSEEGKALKSKIDTLKEKQKETNNG